MSVSDEYAAGFFDGEGTVFAAVRNKRPTPTVIVCITNTVRKPLDLLCDKWGGSIYHRVMTDRRQDQYQWTLAAKKAYPFLCAIVPHLLIKRDIVECAIEYCRLQQLPTDQRVDYSNTVFRDGRRRVAPRNRPEFNRQIAAVFTRMREINSIRAPFNARRRYLPTNQPEWLT